MEFPMAFVPVLLERAILFQMCLVASKAGRLDPVGFVDSIVLGGESGCNTADTDDCDCDFPFQCDFNLSNLSTRGSLYLPSIFNVIGLGRV
jgi:hypothetical protein